MEWEANVPTSLQKAGQYRIIIGSEIIVCIGKAEVTKKVTVLERGAEGSTTVAHPAGSKVYHVPTALALKNILMVNAEDIGGTLALPKVVNLHLSGDTSIGHKLTSVTDPTEPQDAVTLKYFEGIKTPVGIAPTSNPTVSVTINPTISTATAAARALSVEPTFTGSGAGPLGLRVLPIVEPSGSISESDGMAMNCRLNPGAGVTISTGIGIKAKVSTGAGSGVVTETFALSIDLPELGSLKPATCVGVHVNNQGAASVTTSVGVDVLSQTGSTTNIGVRIAKGSTYALQLSDTGGTAAGGIEFGTDTNAHRTAAGVLKLENILDVETGLRIAGVAAAGKYLRGDGTNFISSTLKGGDLEGETVEAAAIKKETITAAKLVLASIDAPQIKLLSLTAALIAKETLTGEKMANQTVTTKQLGPPAAKPAKQAEGVVLVTAVTPAQKVGFTLTGDAVKKAWKIKHSLETRLIQVAIQTAEAEEPGKITLETTALIEYKPISASEVEIIFVQAPSIGIQLFGTVIG